MTLAQLTNTCAACGAEESLDALLARMIDDDQVRRLIAEVITVSLPLGMLVTRYLRLHKPPKQRLRMQRVATLLGELLPDLQRQQITRKAREWQAPTEAWKAAFGAVFDAADKGSLTLPLEGNGYLYETLMRMADQHERQAETAREAERRHRREAGPRDAGAVSVGQLVARATAPAPAPAVPPPAGPSRAALAIRAEIAARRGQPAAGPAAHPTTDPTTHPEEEKGNDEHQG